MKTHLQLASFALDVPEGDWIQLFKKGSQKGFDGRGPYIVENASQIIEASKKGSVELFIDRDHELDLLPRGTPVRAAGWIKEMQAREDGIWARVEWTPRAKEELASKEYKYISPVFYVDVAGRVMKIVRASLTNNPNLELKAVASADPELSSQTEELTMDENLTAIATILGMTGETNPKNIVDAVRALKGDLDSLAKTAGAEKATASAIEEGFKSKAYDPAKHAPLEMVNNLTKEVATLKETVGGDKAAAAVADGVKAGKIAPAMKDWALQYATKDTEGFKKYLETAPVIVAGGESEQGKKPVIAAAELDQAGKEVASQLGIKPDKMKEQLKAQA